MKNLVIQSSNGSDVTTSLIVAEVFKKQHRDVLRDIERLSCSEDFRVRNFAHTPYTHPQNGQTYHYYEMTKDGFSFLVMGYTGAKAGEFKEKFISEFNKREAMLKSDDYILMRSQQILQKRVELAEKKVRLLEVENETLKAKQSYLDVVLQCRSTVTTTAIAQDYGMSAKAFNSTLHGIGIQHRVGGQWILYGKYLKEGYVQSDTISIVRSNGQPDVVLNTKWTQKGRLFLYETLKKRGILPLIEKGGPQC